MINLLRPTNNEQTSAWKNWQQNPCWQELLNMIEEIKNESVKDEDRVSTQDLNLAVIAQSRGVRKGLDTLLRRIGDIK